MFRCQLTGEVSEPREKMVRVIIEERPRTYVNIVDDEEKVTHGTEIVREAQVRLSSIDPTKAAQIATRRGGDPEIVRKQVEFLHLHAAKCKKSPEDCHVCQTNRRFLDSLPAPILTRCLEERRFAQ